MDGVIACVACGAPARSGRFCTTCGIPLPDERAAAVVDPTWSAPVSGWPAPQPPTGFQADPAFAGPAGSPAATAVLTPPPAPWTAPPAAPAGRRAWANVLAVLVLAALGLSVWALMHGTERHILSGSVLVVDSAYDGMRPGASCTGSFGYADIRAGTQAVLSDGGGTTLSTSRLSSGTFDGEGCVFSFALPHVRHADFYSLAVAGANRGQLQYSYDELADADWSLQLSLGDD